MDAHEEIQMYLKGEIEWEKGYVFRDRYKSYIRGYSLHKVVPNPQET